jgi:hypothetical protein
MYCSATVFNFIKNFSTYSFVFLLISIRNLKLWNEIEKSRFQEELLGFPKISLVLRLVADAGSGLAIIQ